ncbi:hypothetical protein BJV82DRAFT_29993 [Fennellomyces sp. T-0311]|nr:hypothetical protein BJV82DRAFT_29993 [Fennellomyces sp. T-0311]
MKMQTFFASFVLSLSLSPLFIRQTRKMKKIFVRIHDRFASPSSTPSDDGTSPSSRKYREKMSRWRSRFSSSNPSILRRKGSKSAFSQSTPCFEQQHRSTNVASMSVLPPMPQRDTRYSMGEKNMSVPEILKVLRTSIDDNDDTVSFTSFRDTLTNSPNSMPCDICPSPTETKRHTISYSPHQRKARSSTSVDETDDVVLQFRAWEPAVEQDATQSQQREHVPLSPRSARLSSATMDDCGNATALTLSHHRSTSEQVLMTQTHLQHCYSSPTQQESCNINYGSKSCANQGKSAKNSDQPTVVTAAINENEPEIDNTVLISSADDKRSSSAAIITSMHVDKIIIEMTLTRKLNQVQDENALLKKQIERLESEVRLALAVNAPTTKDRGAGKAVAGQQDELLRTHALAQLGLIEYLEGEKDLGAALERFKKQLETELSDNNNDQS